MQSRKDLFQAHRLMTQRASLALLRGEPDIPDQPLRRLNVATFSGVLVAVIVCALFGMWGLLGHGGSALKQQPGLLVIDQQTGNSYVFCQRDKLCPVLNYASARLALQSPSVTQQTVSQASLTKFARGPLIGIPGLPQPLPEASLLVRQPWSVCTQSGVGLSGQQTRTALAGGIAAGGRPLGGQALLTRALGQDWVVWDGERMPIQPGTLAELFSSRTPVPVPTVWLNVLPQGPSFAPPAIAGKGATVTGPAGPVQVGQVYDVSLVAGSPLQYYVMLTGGLARITKTQAELLDSELHAPPPAKLNPSQISGHMSRGQDLRRAACRRAFPRSPGPAGPPRCASSTRPRAGGPGWPGRSCSGAGCRRAGWRPARPRASARSCSRPAPGPWSARPRAAGVGHRDQLLPGVRRAQVRAGVEERGQHARLRPVPGGRAAARQRDRPDPGGARARPCGGG